MADWRDNNPKERKLQSPKPFKPKAKTATKENRGWKKKETASSGASRAPSSERNWTGGGPEPEMISNSFVKRWLAIIALFSVAMIGLGWFIYLTFLMPKPLPLVVLSVGKYEAAELAENAYGDAQRAKLGSTNSTNVRALIAEQFSNDNGLSGLANADWLQNFDQIKTKVIGAGGPGRRVVAFYISAYARFAASGKGAEQLRVLTQNDVFAATNSTEKLAKDAGVPLSVLLENIARSVASNHIAWVILDLRAPTVVSNLGDLNPPWETAAQAAFGSLPDNLADRLLVTLPAKNGQRNWLAPEYSSTFFGHYVTQLLAGKFAWKGVFKQELTFAEIRKLLGEKVEKEVTDRRYALQQPVWLPEPNFDAAARTQVVTMGPDQQEETSAAEIVEGNFGHILDAWAKLSGHMENPLRAYRWDPLGYSQAESQLLAMEEFAISGQAGFSSLKDRLLSTWSIQLPQVRLNVSVNEDLARERFFIGEQGTTKAAIDLARLQAAMLSQQAAESLPSFWRAPVADDEEPIVTTEDGFSPETKALYVWEFLVACASRDNQTWRSVFTRERLKAAVEFVPSEQRDLLEIYLLRRLNLDLDWAVGDLDRPPAIAAAISAFDALHKVGSQPEPEIAWWLRDQLQPIETECLLGIDALLAGQSLQASERLQRVTGQTVALAQACDAYSSAIAAAQDALHALPHLLSWSLKDFQIAADAKPIENRLRKLGALADQTDRFYVLLGQKPNPQHEELRSAGQQLRGELDRLLGDFATYVDSVRNAAGNNSQTYQRARIALLTPFLDSEARTTLHRVSADFLRSDNEEELDQGQETSMPTDRSFKAAADAFLSSIEVNREQWQRYLDGDPRFGLESFFATKDLPAASSPIELRTELLAVEYWQRAFATVFGHTPSLQASLASSERDRYRWPWSAAWQRWMLSESARRVLQVERLATSAWGDGSFDGQSPAQSFFFAKLASRYAPSGQVRELPPLSKFASSFERSMAASIDSAAQRLQSQRAQFGSSRAETISGNQSKPVEVLGEPWEAIACVYLGTVNERKPWRPREPGAAPARDDRAWDAYLARPEQRRTELVFAGQYWSDPAQRQSATLALRGNYRTEVVPWQLQNLETSSVVLSMRQYPPAPTVVRVNPPKEKPKATVLLLLDCSDSMDKTVQFRREDNSIGSAKLYGLVKEAATAVLEKFAEIHGDEAEITLGYIPLGDGKDYFNQPYVYKETGGFRKFAELDGGWASTIENAIRAQPSNGDTPLYNAISLALENVPSDTTQDAFIYVFTDGENYINTGNKIREKYATDVQRALRSRTNASLNIYFFDYSDTSAAGLKQLEDLGAGFGRDRYRFYSSKEARDVTRESLASIERPWFEIRSADGDYSSGQKRLGERVTVPIAELPGSFEISVSGPLGSAGARVPLYGGENLGFDFETGGSPRIEIEAFRRTGGELQTTEKAGGKLAAEQLLLGIVDDQLGSSNSTLGFQLKFWNGSLTAITPRPNFVVAEASQSDQRKPATFLLADHLFEPVSFPEARLSKFPWPKQRPPVRLRVWASDADPEKIRSLKLEPEDAQDLTLGIATVSCRHAGDRLVATVDYGGKTPEADDRVVVICTQANAAEREFETVTLRETHQFFLPPSRANLPATLKLITVGELDLEVEAENVTRFEFDRIQL